jgi:uncharacterized membrane protein YfcA
MEWGLFLIAGCIAGAMSGLLGIGGGTIIVPALSMIFTKQANIPDGVVMHMASGTALCIMIFTSASSTFTHFKHGSRAWLYFRRVVLYIIIGIVLGALVADFLPTYMMKKVFGGFLILVAFEMQFGRLISRIRFRPTKMTEACVMLVIGCISGLLGIGGGTLIFPYLSRCRMTTRKITSISAACSLTAGVIGTISVMTTGYNNTFYIPWSTGYVYWPAVLLAAFPSIIFAHIFAAKAYTMPIKYLRLAFVVFLAVIGLKMIW